MNEIRARVGRTGTVWGRLLVLPVVLAAVLTGLLTAGPATATPFPPPVTGYPNNLYGVQSGTGNLLCYVHKGYLTGGGTAADWAGPVTVGTSWNGFSQLFSTSGSLYGIQSNGNLYWYRHTNYQNCAAGIANWSPLGGTVVTGGLYSVVNAFGMTGTAYGTGGVFYTIDSSGNLRWYRHYGYKSATNSWHPASGTIVGTGWNNFTKVFAGQNGQVYAVRANGDVWEYFHFGWQDGSVSWSNPTTVNQGWSGYSKLMGGPDGVIYGINPAGNLIWYRHLGHDSANPNQWQGPFQVGYSWTGFTKLVVYSPTPPNNLN